MMGNLSLRAPERNIVMNAMQGDQPGSAANLGVEVRSNEQNILNRGQTTLFRDQICLRVSSAAFCVALTIEFVGQSHNAYQNLP